MSYRVGIDVGGTFTDFLLLDEQGKSSVFKTPTTPHDHSIGLMNGLREIAEDQQLSLEVFVRQVDLVVHGTTVATNAVLTGKGANTGLITTQGFRDALEMRRGIRESQYDNHFVAPVPLVPRHCRLPVRERVDVKGAEVTPLNRDDVLAAARQLLRQQVESVAVCLLHSHANGAHEQQVAEILSAELPAVFLSISSELMPQIRFYDRTSTTVLNSYVGPLIQRYLDNLLEKLDATGFAGVLLIMQSNGGVAGARQTTRVAAATVLSGPAAGPVAGLSFVRPHGLEDCITVDMGGTSFDAALIVAGQPVSVTDGRINGHLMALPKLDIHTIGAGGGSVAWIDSGGFLRMGPDSAGADPGPACYGRGGERPTCSDADLVLGYLNPDYFLGGRIPLSLEKAKQAIEREIAGPLGLELERAAAGMSTVINHAMADGIRAISIQRGYDPRDFPLVVAGGAGPVHAAAIARELEIPLILVPRASSIFCAAGMLLSDLRHAYVRSCPTTLAELKKDFLAGLCREMSQQARATLDDERIPRQRQRLDYSADIRYVGQFNEVSVALPGDDSHEFDLEKLSAAFHARHDLLYGYAVPEAALEMVTVRLDAVGLTEKHGIIGECGGGFGSRPEPKSSRPIFLPELDEFHEVPVFDGDTLSTGQRISGPALVEQIMCTVVVPSDYRLVCDRLGSFALFPVQQQDRFEAWLTEEKIPPASSVTAESGEEAIP